MVRRERARSWWPSRSTARAAGRDLCLSKLCGHPGHPAGEPVFGTEKGSYTGALTRKGLLEEADGGTLFLDEINSMDPALQAKLLKVLEEKKVRRLGAAGTSPSTCGSWRR